MEFADFKAFSDAALHAQEAVEKYEAKKGQRLIENLQNFKQRSADLHAFFTKGKELWGGLENAQKFAGDRSSEFYKHAVNCRKQDDVLLRRMAELMKLEDRARIDEVKQYVIETFNTVFKRMRSRKEVVATGKPHIIIATYGFGIQHAVQGQRVQWYSDIEKIFEQIDEIEKSLNNLGLSKWSQKLRVFQKLLPKFDANEGSHQMEIPQVLLPKEDFSWRLDKPPSTATHLSVDESWLTVGGGTDSYQFRLEQAHEELPDGVGAIAYVLARQHFAALVKQLEEEILPFDEKIKKIKTDLQNNFGREILFMEV